VKKVAARCLFGGKKEGEPHLAVLGRSEKEATEGGVTILIPPPPLKSPGEEHAESTTRKNRRKRRKDGMGLEGRNPCRDEGRKTILLRG